MGISYNIYIGAYLDISDISDDFSLEDLYECDDLREDPYDLFMVPEYISVVIPNRSTKATVDSFDPKNESAAITINAEQVTSCFESAQEYFAPIIQWAIDNELDVPIVRFGVVSYSC